MGVEATSQREMEDLLRAQCHQRGMSWAGGGYWPHCGALLWTPALSPAWSLAHSGALPTSVLSEGCCAFHPEDDS